MGCNVDWGGPNAMPESGKPIFKDVDDIRIPPDLLARPGCRVPLEAIRLLEAAAGRRRGRVRQGVGRLDPGLPLLRRRELPDGHARRPGQDAADPRPALRR